MSLLSFIACSNDDGVLEEPNLTTVIVTVTYQNGKLIKFIYHNNLIWQSDLVESMSYHQNDGKVYIDYTNLNNQTDQIVFQGGKVVEEQ